MAQETFPLIPGMALAKLQFQFACKAVLHLSKPI